MRAAPRPAPRRLLGVALLVLLASACRLDVNVGIDVNEDGSGVVRVAVGLDDDAMSKIPDLGQQVRVDDLTATGWTVTGPTKEADGMTWMRASKPFSTPAEAAAVLAEVAGEQGPFRDFALTRKRSFARTSFDFSGTVDFTGGIEAFSDQELTQLLDGEPLGQDVATIEQQIGESLDRVFHFQVAVQLPGSVSSNAPGEASNGAVWTPQLSDSAPQELHATSRSWHTSTLAWTAAAVVAGLALVVVLLVRLVRSARRGRGQGAAPI